MRKFTKRTAAVVVPTVLLTAVGVAYAASITTTSTSLGSGGTDVSSCAASAAVSYTEKFVPGVSAHYGVDVITVAFKDDTDAAATACDDDSWRLVVTKGTGAGKGVVMQEYHSGASGTSISGGSLVFTVPTTDDINAADVTGVYVVTEGTPDAP